MVSRRRISTPTDGAAAAIGDHPGEMAEEHGIHVEFARVVDRVGAIRTLSAHGLGAVAGSERAIEIGCRPGDEERVLDEVAHVLDEWLRARGLPFTAARTEARKLFVRPPSD